MGAKSYVSRWGSSLAVRIPQPVAEQWGVQEGSAIEIVPRGDQIVLRKKTYDLAGMLAQVKPDHSIPNRIPAQPKVAKSARLRSPRGGISCGLHPRLVTDLPWR